jgi:hypothetical protein
MIAKEGNMIILEKSRPVNGNISSVFIEDILNVFILSMNVLSVGDREKYKAAVVNHCHIVKTIFDEFEVVKENKFPDGQLNSLTTEQLNKI